MKNIYRKLSPENEKVISKRMQYENEKNNNKKN